MYLHEHIDGIHYGFEYLIPHKQFTHKPVKHIAYNDYKMFIYCYNNRDFNANCIFFPNVTRFVSYTDEKNKTFNLERLDRFFFKYFFEHLYPLPNTSNPIFTCMFHAYGHELLRRTFVPIASCSQAVELFSSGAIRRLRSTRPCKILSVRF
jgi:hypothetical protein